LTTYLRLGLRQGDELEEELGKIHASGTAPRATSAAGAENLSEAAGIDGKLVLDSLAEALTLALARIVSRGVKGE
jgi:hypothetical protein